MGKIKDKYSDTQEMLIGKLLDLKYRINEAYRGYPCEVNKNDKSWVMGRCDDVRNGKTLTKGAMLHCNNLWKDYGKGKVNNG